MKVATRQLLLTRDKSLAEELSPSDQESFEVALICFENEDYQQALDSFLAIKNKNGSACFFLGVLYAQQYQDYEQAVHYWRLAVEQGYAAAMNNLAWLYFKTKTKKHEALHYAQLATEQFKDSDTLHTFACIALWHDHIDDTLQAAQTFMTDVNFLETHEAGVIDYLTLLLAKKHSAEVADYFAMPHLQLKERFKPLYYALLHLTAAREYATLPPELVEPVNDIITRIKQMAVDYD